MTLLYRGARQIPDPTVVHTSTVVPRCMKVPFLGKDEYEIGPCYTAPESRGALLGGSGQNYIGTEALRLQWRRGLS